MIWAACRTIQGTIGSSRLILVPVLASRADLSVRVRPLKSWIALSTRPLELLSPTLACSMAVPDVARAAATARWTSVMAGS